MISRIIFQTGKSATPPESAAAMMEHCPGWEYRYFADDDCRKFFRENPVPGFEKFEDVFNRQAIGEFRSDLFRYYFLYVCGGVFIDNDATLFDNLPDTLGEADLLLTEAFRREFIFNGFIGSAPRHPLIAEALRGAYRAPPHRGYLQLCGNLRAMAEPYKKHSKTILCREDNDCRASRRAMNLVRPDGKAIGGHWSHVGRVPTPDNPIPFNWNDYCRRDARDFPLCLLRTHPLPSYMSFIRIGSKHDGGYVVANGLDYDCILTGGIRNNWQFEEQAIKQFKTKCIAVDQNLPSPLPKIENIQWVRQVISRGWPLHRYIQPHRKLLVKMDIEGTEYAWLQGLSDAELSHMRQLIMEVHFPFSPSRWGVLERLHKQFALVHVHANNFAGLCPCSVTVPEVLELTYLHRSVCSTQPYAEPQSYPKPGLDFPNAPRRTDYTFSL